MTEAEVASVLKRPNNNKAVDIMGLTSENFKLAGQEITEYPACLMNYIIGSGSVSMVLKEGILSSREVTQAIQATIGVLQ